jgi:predicted ATPase/DNA-binding CsgD family transcriptional regulator
MAVYPKRMVMKNSGLTDGEVYANDLTWREQDILVLLAERLTNREIADSLHLAESTVKDYVGNILSKLYVKNRREAVERATDLGLLNQDRKTAPVLQTNLPPERTPFVGRRDELTEIRQQLGETRLLSLIGPGGMGKTRLALKAAEGAADDFADGIFFVPLAPIRSVKDIIQTIAEGLKFPIATHEDPKLQLLRYLQKRQLLLVMDNFEHLLDGVGIVSEILQAAPGVKILATSRERLNLQSETVLHVVGMAFPDQDDSKGALTYDSITLFMQSAKKVRPGFDPSPDELVQITNICQSVGGMPLAIELAAAWLHIINVDEIANELERDIDILATEVRDAPARHRSIRAVFDHSWSLLDQSEQEIFMRLSVFRGGFTREATHQVAGASLQLLAGLVNKSFLNHDPVSGRLEVHELLRQYAQEQLEKNPEVSISAQEAHAAYFAEFMQQRWEDLKCSKQMQALAEIETDMENVRGAWRYYLGQKNAPQIWKLIYGLWHFHWIRSWNHAGMELFSEAAKVLQETDDETRALRALAMAFQAFFMAWLGIPESGYELAGKSVDVLEQLNHPKALWFAYDSMIINAYFLSRITEQAEATNELVEIAAEIDDKWLTAYMLFAPSMIALISGDYAEAQRLAETDLDLYEEIGDVIGSTMPITILGHVALAREEYERAKQFYLRCLKISQRAGFNYSLQTSSKYLAKVSLLMGDYVETDKYLGQCLTLSKEVSFVRDVINLLYEFARLKAAQNNLEEAVKLLVLVIEHPTSNQTRWLEGRIRDSAKELLADLEKELAPEAYTAALERGGNLELDEVVADLIG